jgi:hypothetical protein
MHDWRRPGDSSARGSSRQTEESEKGEEVDSPSKDKDGNVEKDTGRKKGARTGSTQQAASQAKKKARKDDKVDKKEAKAEDKSSDRFTWTSKTTKLLIFLTLSVEQEALGEDDDGNKTSQI